MGCVLFFSLFSKCHQGVVRGRMGKKKKKKGGCVLGKSVQTLCEEVPALNLGRMQQSWVCY